jgi:hypothetical protein
VERRTVLRTLAGGIAGTVVSSNTPVSAHTPHDSHDQSSMPAQGTASPAARRFLDDHQRQTLASVADLLVPGAVAAGAVDLIDRVLAVESMPRQREFLNALGAFEREARESNSARWIDLDEPARVVILERASSGLESQPLPPPWTKGEPIVFTEPKAAAATLRDHFTRLRMMVAKAYFATEAGMRELGWMGRTGWTELPGCTHDDPAHR